MCAWLELIQVVSHADLNLSSLSSDVKVPQQGNQTNWILCTVVPSNMNPIGAQGNIFSSLFEKVPAKRAGDSNDMAGTVLYLVSKSGVSHLLQALL